MEKIFTLRIARTLTINILQTTYFAWFSKPNRLLVISVIFKIITNYKDYDNALKLLDNKISLDFYIHSTRHDKKIRLKNVIKVLHTLRFLLPYSRTFLRQLNNFL